MGCCGFKKCCCCKCDCRSYENCRCFDPKTEVYLIAICGVFLWLFFWGYVCFIMVDIVHKDISDDSNMLTVVVGISIISGVGVILNIVLFMGVKRQEPKILLIWIILYAVFEFVFFLCFLAGVFFAGNESDDEGTDGWGLMSWEVVVGVGLFMDVAKFFINLYFIYLVWAYYQMLADIKYGRKEGAEEDDGPYANDRLTVEPDDSDNDISANPFQRVWTGFLSGTTHHDRKSSPSSHGTSWNDEMMKDFVDQSQSPRSSRIVPPSRAASSRAVPSKGSAHSSVQKASPERKMHRYRVVEKPPEQKEKPVEQHSLVPL